MKPSSSDARTYRLLGCLALAHALALFALFLSFTLLHRYGAAHQSLMRGWVGFATLWFFWPLVLILHRGRSTRRFAIFASVSAVLFLPSLVIYNREAPTLFGFPWGISMNPLTDWNYLSAYWAGRTEAKKDVAAGIMAMEVYGFGGGGPGAQILRDRYRIEIRPVAGCLVDEEILGHAAGYNGIAKPEIDRRVGQDRIAAAQKEGARLADEKYARQKQYLKALTERFSIFPPDSKIALEYVQPYINGDVLLKPDIEEQLEQVVREIENFVRAAVPEDSPPFDLRISATLSATKPPRYQTVGSRNSPQATYMKIYRDLPGLRLPQWQEAELGVMLKFAIRAQPPGSVSAPDHGDGGR